MSKISLEPNASGAGTFSIVSPDSNTNRTLTLPDEEGTVATIENIPPGYEDQDALDLFNVSGSAPVFACRAWVNFDGTDGSIRSSGNVSSVTRITTGRYRVNFLTEMPDANYVGFFQAGNDASNFSTLSQPIYLTTSFEFAGRNSGANRVDREFSNVSIFR